MLEGLISAMVLSPTKAMIADCAEAAPDAVTAPRRANDAIK